MQYVVVNGDDFGLNTHTNNTIITAHTTGVLTSASLMVNEAKATEAAAMAAMAPRLAVGLHTVLSCGRPALPPASISQLVTRDGQFRKSPALAGMAAYFSASARAQVRNEVRAQFERFARTALPWSHVDGHQHMHLHPVAWDCIVPLCEEFGVRRVRIPHEELVWGGPAVRKVEWLLFRALRLRCIRSLAGKGFTVADRVYGHLHTGRMDERRLLDLFSRLKGTSNEIYLHPGANVTEASALTSNAVRAAAAAVKLSTYKELSIASER